MSGMLFVLCVIGAVINWHIAYIYGDTIALHILFAMCLCLAFMAWIQTMLANVRQAFINELESADYEKYKAP